MKFSWLMLPLTLLGLAYTATRPEEIPFVKHELDTGANESCAFADINGDGKLDIVSGENWYEAPRWTKHRFRDINFENGYIDAFSDLPLDVDGDGAIDIVTASWFGKKIAWWRNPGRSGGKWVESPVQTGYNVEFAFLVDLDNDGKAREVLPEFGNGNAPLAWYEVKDGKWLTHVIAPKSYGHGIGAGDINGDGRNDIITPEGWFEAPADPRSGDWKFHQEFKLGATGFLFARDINGDGKNDIVTSMAHDYGVMWYEQKGDGTWTKHLIDDTWSQAHAMEFVDWGNGRMGWLTGKRYMAHDHDPGARDALGVYWYEAIKAANGQTGFVRHVIDYSTRTGAGMQVAIADYDKDGDLDFAVGGKSGVYLFENQTRKVH